MTVIEQPESRRIVATIPLAPLPYPLLPHTLNWLPVSEPRSTATSHDDATSQFLRLRTTEYPWTDRVTYLNNASIGPLPERTRRALEAFTARRTAPHSFRDSDLADVLEQARLHAARLINADVTEIGLATNTSYGLNIAAAGLPVVSGEIVILPDAEFPANVYPWLKLRERGVVVERVPLNAAGWPDEERILERLRDPRVRVLAISLVQFASGFRADLERLGAAARQNGTFVVVDAIQGIGAVPFDVGRTPVDVLSCGAQKWLLAPWGGGFFYVRRELHDVLRAPFGGWMAFEGTDDFTRLTTYDMTPRPDARRYELVTLPFQDMLAMTESTRLLLEIGIERIAEHLRSVREPVLEAQHRGVLEIVSPLDERHDSGIICIRTGDTGGAYHSLNRAGVVSAFREGVIRLSPHWYNTRQEIERVMAIVDESG